MAPGPSKDRWLALTLLCVVLVALALRLPHLDARPMHNDEAVNAILFQGLWERGDYRYNPDEYHGPALHYATLPFAWLSDAKSFEQLRETTLRQVTVAASVVLILLLWFLRDALGRTATAAAAMLIAASPAMVFYSRYFIHEMLLVASTLLFLAATWRLIQQPKARWAIAAGTGLGLMHATKETCVLHLAAMGLASAACIFWNRRHGDSQGVFPRREHLRCVPLALGIAAGVSILFFTSFFTHARGPLDSILTYLPWLNRAGGHSPHVHPWSFYFERLLWFTPPRGPVWTEVCIALLAVVGAFGAFSGTRLGNASFGFARFLVLYTLTVAATYSAIPYKTPWCLLNFLLPGILLAGLGAQLLIRSAPGRTGPWIVGSMIAVGIAHLAWQSERSSQEIGPGRSNPYAYSPTLPNGVALSERVNAIARIAATGIQTEVLVVAPDSAYWPLPWYFRSLHHVGWLESLPEKPQAPIVLAAAQLKAALDEKSQRRYLSVGYYELRSREFFELFVEFELWKRFVESLPRPKEDE